MTLGRRPWKASLIRSITGDSIGSRLVPREEEMKIITWIVFAILYVFMISIVVLMSHIFDSISPVVPWLQSTYTGLLICAVTVGTVIGIKIYYNKRKK